jgi:hypothetical protein
VASRRYPMCKTVVAAAAATLAVVGTIALSANAFADDAGSSAPAPGAPIIRIASRGIVQDNAATAISAPKGTAYSVGNDASKGAPILIHDGNQSPLCFANGMFDNTACGLG